MLTDREKSNLTDLLVRVNLIDLLDLARTSTSGHILVETKEDAINVILQHNETLQSVLSRKRITKSCLYQYLHDKKICLSSSIGKTGLIMKTLEYWTQNKEQNAIETSFEDPGVLSLFSTQFSKWFYDKVNGLVNFDNLILDESDFWSQSDCLININSMNSTQTQEANSSTEIVNMYRQLQTEYTLIFSPNLTQTGTKAKIDLHGLILILTCGTLHLTTGELVGIFEQMFVLARDPNLDHWKIRKTELNLKSGATHVPQLPETLQCSIPCSLQKVRPCKKSDETCLQVNKTDAEQGICTCRPEYIYLNDVCVPKQQMPSVLPHEVFENTESYVNGMSGTLWVLIPCLSLAVMGTLILLGKKYGLTEKLYTLRVRRYNTVFVSSANVDDDAPIT